MISKKLKPFGTTIFAEMTRLAVEHDAINLSQGFPDFEGPREVRDAAVAALESGENQYARSNGHPRLVKAVAAHQAQLYGLEYDPMREVGVFSGCTEAIASSLLGLFDPGDEVVLFEPYYDSYPAVLSMAGAAPRFCTLRFPGYALDVDALEALVGPRTRAIMLNTPHNPSGKVFTVEELDAIADVARRHDLIVISDEVYEHLTFDGIAHVPIASRPGMKVRTLTLSSAGKSFGFTGWKVGWATGPASLIEAAQAAHQFVTFATATPLQVAVAVALESLGEEFYESQRRAYQERRDFLASLLEESGFEVSLPQGTYFILADFRNLWQGDDVTFVRHLVAEKGVAAIPPSVFYKDDVDEGRHLVRFAFCKRMETLQMAAERLRS